MIESMASFYVRVILNLQLLLHNPSESRAILALKIASLCILLWVAFRMLLHIRSIRALKTSLAPYSRIKKEREVRAFESALRLVTLKNSPQLYEFFDRKPGLFPVGSWKPAIFLSPKLAAALTDEQLRAALVHELVHLQRNDALRVWIERLVPACLPLALAALFATDFIYVDTLSRVALVATSGVLLSWVWLQKQRASTRERSCDDQTVILTGDSLGLASALVQAWKTCSVMPQMQWRQPWLEAQPFLKRTSEFERRVERLADYRRPFFRPLLAKLAKSAALAVLLAALTFVVWFHSSERNFLAERMWTQACISMSLLSQERLQSIWEPQRR